MDDVKEAIEGRTAREEELDGQVSDHVGRSKDDQMLLDVIVARKLHRLDREVPRLSREMRECERPEDRREEERHPRLAADLDLETDVERRQNDREQRKLPNPLCPHPPLPSAPSSFLCCFLCCFPSDRRWHSPAQRLAVPKTKKKKKKTTAFADFCPGTRTTSSTPSRL